MAPTTATTMAASNDEMSAPTTATTITAINDALTRSDYRCTQVSWDDVCRGTVGGGLSSLGANITDTRLFEKNGRQLFTVRSDNFNEKLGKVSADELALITGNQEPDGNLKPITLRDFL